MRDQQLLYINHKLRIPLAEVQFSAIRSSGPGGQHVNKVSTAIRLKLDVLQSSLPEYAKQRILQFRDNKITPEGTIVIKAQSHRTQEKNKRDALDRLKQLIVDATHENKPRKETQPSRAIVKKRKDNKVRQSFKKALRKKLEY